MGHHKHLSPCLDLGDDQVLPIGDHTVERILQTLSQIKSTSPVGNSDLTTSLYFLSFAGCR